MFTTHAIPIEGNKCYQLNTPQAASLLSGELPLVLHEEILPVHRQNDPSWANKQGSENMSGFCEIHSGGSNDKIGFYQLKDHTLWLVTADAKGPLLQGSMPSAAPCPRAGQTLPSEEIPSRPEAMEVAVLFPKFAQTLGNLQPHKNVLSKSGEQWIEYISFSSLTFCT